MTFTIERLAPIGARIHSSVDFLLSDQDAPATIMKTLEANGVVMFRGLHLDDAKQVALSRRLGEPFAKKKEGWGAGEFPEIFHVSLDRSINDNSYMKSTFGWHIDGTTGGAPLPPKATLLTARVLPAEGSQTQFASTYAAYERLSDEEKRRFQGLKVMHALEASYRRVQNEPTPEVLAQLQADPNQLQPLVWTHRDGRKSLVIGTHAWYVDGMPRDEGAALLLDLEERATRPEYVYTHEWEVGDLVIWDNRGVMHRAVPYADDSGRNMHRVTLVGDEPIQ